MSDMSTPSAIDTAVDAVLAEIEQARTAEQYRDACVSRMAGVLQLAAINAYTDVVAEITKEGFHHLANGVPADMLISGVTAANAEGRRLLALLGIDMPAVGEG